MRTLSLNKPHLIVMVGIPGSGKSFFIEHFAETFNAPLVSFDHLRNELFHTPTFNNNEYEIIQRIADRQLDELLKTGRTILIDGSAQQRQSRTNLTKKARDAGYETLFIWVQTESVAARHRATKPVKGKTALSQEQFDAAVKRFSAPHLTEHAVVISGKHTYASQLKIVLKRLIEPRTEIADAQVAPRSAPNRNILIR